MAKDSGDVTRYGFTWGPIRVTRAATFPAGRSLSIETDHRKLDVFVSPKGRSVRVYDRNQNKELK